MLVIVRARTEKERRKDSKEFASERLGRLRGWLRGRGDAGGRKKALVG